MGNLSIFMQFSPETKERLYANLSPKPYCTNNFQKQGLLIRPKEQAFTYAYLQLNNHWSDTYLNFDVDRPGAAWAWDDADILAPTFVTINPENWHAHLVFELITPVWKQGSEKPIKWMRAISKGLTEILGADPGYTGLISQNPNHPRWEILDFGGRNELVELWETVEVYKKYATPPKPVQERINLSAQSNFLFHDGRFYGKNNTSKSQGIGENASDIEELEVRTELEANPTTTSQQLHHQHEFPDQCQARTRCRHQIRIELW